MARSTRREGHPTHPVAATQVAQQSGQSLVEIALVLPLLMFVIVIALDLGRAYFSYVALVAAAEQGARAAADLRNDGTTINTAVKAEPGAGLTIADGDIAVSCPDGSALVPGVPDSCRVRGRPVSITVRTGFRTIGPFVVPILGTNTIELQATASEMVK